MGNHLDALGSLRLPPPHRGVTTGSVEPSAYGETQPRFSDLYDFGAAFGYEWRNSPRAPYFISHMESGARGLTVAGSVGDFSPTASVRVHSRAITEPPRLKK